MNGTLMFVVLLRKMRSTKWMVLCLLAGFIAASGMMSAIPIYTDASLVRLLSKDMEAYQLETGEFPGGYYVAFGSPQAAELTDANIESLGIPTVSRKLIIADDMFFLQKAANKRADSGDSKKPKRNFSLERVRITGMSDFPDNAVITSGRMCGDSVTGKNGETIIETVVTEHALKGLGITVGDEYDINPIVASGGRFKVRVTGTFEPKMNTENPAENSYWTEKMSGYINSLFIDYDLYRDALIPGGAVSVTAAQVRYGLDYHKIDMNRIAAITGEIRRNEREYTELGYEFTMDTLPIMESYIERSAALTRTLRALQIPAVVMLGFYLVMVSRLNADRERNEIALLKSRGASAKQVFGLYAMQSGVLGLVSFILAPVTGAVLCRFIGVSNGFLEFVNRSGISVKITRMSFIYAFAAAVIFFAASVLPVIPAVRLSIVEYKRNRAKAAKKPLWEKAFLDIALVGIGISVFFIPDTVKTEILHIKYGNGEIDPLIFIFACTFIAGAGLLFLRLYPYLLSLIYRIGRERWTAPQYIALTTVRQMKQGERFVMMFLCVTFSLGLFSANTARTVNNNKADMLYYTVGADVVIREHNQASTGLSESDYSYTETDFSRYENLSGVQIATKVLRNGDVTVRTSDGAEQAVHLMAIEPEKFAQTAWFRDDLLPIHWYNYCNALTDCPSGVIVSGNMKSLLGGGAELTWGRDNKVSGDVVAAVDWWPGINPNETPYFAVVNYNFIKSQTEPEPYEIWLKTGENASEALYNDISGTKPGLPVRELLDAHQMLIAEKNDPRLQSMNGTLTLGFTVIMVMTVSGFLIYWILSVKGRTLQFGVLRAMGLSFREVIATIGCEQVLVTVSSIIAAFVIGGIGSNLYVPLFRNMYPVNEQVPPFYAAASRLDYIRIYAIIAVMLAVCLTVIGGIIKKMNINKALKLGED